MQSESLFRIRLVVGDWSHDGHSMTKDVWVLSNRGDSGLRKAYEKGAKAVGADLTRDVCRAYEDSQLPRAVLDRLIAAGYKTPWADDPDVDSTEVEAEDIYMDPAWFAEVWLFIASRGDPDLKFEIIEDEPSINIGGYGLFAQ